MVVDAGLTDALLAVACALGAWRSGSRPAGVGLLVVGAAACAGAARFLGADAVIPAHQLLVAASQGLGLPLVGLGALAAAGWIRERGVVAGAVAGVGLRLLGTALGSDLPGTVAAALGMVAVVAACGARRAWSGVLGALLVVVGGLAVAGEGSWAGLHRDAWFHLVMVAAVLSLGDGVRRTLSPA